MSSEITGDSNCLAVHQQLHNQFCSPGGFIDVLLVTWEMSLGQREIKHTQFPILKCKIISSIMKERFRHALEHSSELPF